jgi:AcrR family transcriptional regulator
MAKRSSRRKAAEEKDVADNPRDAAIDAFMTLLADASFADIGLDAIADKAGLSLSALRGTFPNRVAILAAFAERIDLAVLASGPVEGEGERDRLFDILMRRLDAMTPHRAALLSIARAAAMNPAVACAVALSSNRSMRWMLAAARVEHAGFAGQIAVSGAGLAFAQAMNTWLRHDGDNEKTMAALDSALRNGERAMGVIRDACGFVAGLARRARDAGRKETTGDAGA